MYSRQLVIIMKFCSRQLHHFQPLNTNLRVPEFQTYRPNPVYPSSFAFQYQPDQRRPPFHPPSFPTCNMMDMRARFGNYNSDGGSNSSSTCSPIHPAVNSTTSRCASPSEKSDAEPDRTDNSHDRVTPSPEPQSTPSSDNSKFAYKTMLFSMGQGTISIKRIHYTIKRNRTEATKSLMTIKKSRSTAWHVLPSNY